MIGEEKAKTEKPITIQDIVVVNVPHPELGNKLVGEFLTTNPTGKWMWSTPEETQEVAHERLLKCITTLVNDTASVHKKNNGNEQNQLASGKENNITRLITNEFFFYTRKPLTIDQFQLLQKDINNLAAQQPENLHLVLSSFAVKTAENKVMNVVAHVECGKDPKLNFIVKNNPSPIDPKYKEMDNDRLEKLLNVNFNDKLEPPFSFNNVLECKTKGGEKFNCCIDVCYDHVCGVAKNRFDQKIIAAEKSLELGGNEPIPILSSHVITSCTVMEVPAHTLGKVTQADPVWSYSKCKEETPGLDAKFVNDSSFGTPQWIFITDPQPLKALPPAQLERVQSYNQKVMRGSENFEKKLTALTKDLENNSSRSDNNAAKLDVTQLTSPLKVLSFGSNSRNIPYLTKEKEVETTNTIGKPRI